MSIAKIAEGVHGVAVGGVNVFLLEDASGLTLIDAAFPDKAEVVLDAVRGLGAAPADVKHIVLTHAHPDHIGSLAALKRATGARTYIHPLDRAIVERGSGFRPMTAAPGLLPKLLFALLFRPGVSVEPTAIDQTIEDGERLPVAGGLRVIHCPGHCAGQVALLSEARGVLFVADVATHVMGLGPPIGYEDRALGEASRRRLAAFDFDVAGFGHGKALTGGAAEAFRRKWG